MDWITIVTIDGPLTKAPGKYAAIGFGIVRSMVSTVQCQQSGTVKEVSADVNFSLWVAHLDRQCCRSNLGAVQG